MDASKYPLEKLAWLVCGIIPGLVALVIYQVHSPGHFTWFFSIGFLGYRAKLAVILSVALIVGHTIARTLNGILGAIGGAVGAGWATTHPYKPTASEEIAPWRDTRWRTALKKHLGSGSPPDTAPMRQSIYDTTLKLIDMMPQEKQALERLKLEQEKLQSESDDLKWSEWYIHYHKIVLTRQDFASHIHAGLSFNLAAASVYVLICATFMPQLRHWWCLWPAVLWILIVAAENHNAFKKLTDEWSTLDDQIKYLRATTPEPIA